MDYIDVHTIDGRHVHINRQAIVTIGGPARRRGAIDVYRQGDLLGHAVGWEVHHCD